jgi:tetratricopeptide (TPR) repeat protein
MNKCPFCGNTLINGRHRFSHIDFSDFNQPKDMWECLDKKEIFPGKVSKEEWKNAPKEIENDYRNRRSIFISDFRISINPEDPKAFKERGIAYYNLKNYKQAISDFSKAISFDPKDGELNHLRRQCYKKIGEDDKADQDFIIASKKGYKNIKS